MNKWSALSDKQKLAVLLVVLVLLSGFGIGSWAMERFSSSDSEEGAGPSSASSSSSVEAVSPVESSPTDSPSSSPSSGSATSTSSGSSGSSSSSSPQDQDASAKAALKSVVPKWVSLDYGKVGSDQTEWAKQWRDDPAAASSFVSQSRGEFVPMFRGVIALEANAKADSLKRVKKVWQEGTLSGWQVDVDRKLSSPGGSGSVNETETLKWEFTVEQQSDGSSQVTAFTEQSFGDD